MKMPSPCDAYQASDQMICPTCATGWDVNDLEPPQCPKTLRPARASGNVHADKPAAPLMGRIAMDQLGKPALVPATPGEGHRFIARALSILGSKDHPTNIANPFEHPTKPPGEKK